MRRLSDRRGSTLVLNVLTVSIFALLAGVVWVSARSQVKTAVYQTRQLQAQAIAEAGLEDALATLRGDSTWRTGFTDKAFADGTYTVVITTDTPPAITSTGFSKSIFGFGSAVKSISVQTKLVEGLCPYAVAGDGSMTIAGTIDKYDPSVTLTPSATEFIQAGAHVRTNASITITGSCSPPTSYIVYGTATYRGSISGGSCAMATEGPSVSTITIPVGYCPTCSSINDNDTITPSSVVTGGGKKLTVGSGETATMYPGSYYFTNFDLDGTLNVITDTGTATIYLDPGVFRAGTGCQINNSSKIPSRLKFVDIKGNPGNTAELRCSTPLHAHFEGSFGTTDISQEIYGHLCSGGINLSATGKIHYDGNSVTHVAWTIGSAGSWKESYERP